MKTNKQFIVITTIFEPTKAVKLFSSLNDFSLILVGDKKTPENYNCENSLFLSINDQDKSNYKIKNHLPYNHYCRKMIGYLEAMKLGADYIIDTDDDNIPKTNYKFPIEDEPNKHIEGGRGFINIYNKYTDQKIWPRGLPLRLINHHSIDPLVNSNKTERIGIWQGLADEDPDVDALYRLTDNKICYFNDNGNFVLNKGTISPFNSQNTRFEKDLFALLYLPTSVTFRFTDILRSYIAQPIMWSKDYLLGFTNATVVQERNPHDFVKDFESEIPMYLNADKVIDLCTKAIRSNQSINDNLVNCYEVLLTNNIVLKSEIDSLIAWIDDIESIRKYT